MYVCMYVCTYIYIYTPFFSWSLPKFPILSCAGQESQSMLLWIDRIGKVLVMKWRGLQGMRFSIVTHTSQSTGSQAIADHLESILTAIHRGCRNMVHNLVDFLPLNSCIKQLPWPLSKWAMPTVTVDGGSVRAVGADHVAVLAQNGTRLDPSWIKQQWHMHG